MKGWIYGMAFLLCAAALALLLAPHVSEAMLGREQEEEIRAFEEEKEEKGIRKPQTDPLYEQMEQYNERIFEEKQAGLRDAFSYEEHASDLFGAGTGETMIGYLEIEKMDLRIPLYIGADQENLSKGAAVLSQTSMPVGGKDTNCVIAAHRGYGGERMFRNIEELEEGDLIRITNPWTVLTYRVYRCGVIRPSDIEAVKIVEGLDMVTLCTCHPLGSNEQRYVVYALREDRSTGDRGEDAAEDAREVLPEGEWMDYEPSAGQIYLERVMNLAGIGVMAVFLMVLIVFGVKERRGKKRES